MAENNFLLMYPVKFPHITTEEVDGQLKLTIHHTGFFSRLAAKIFRSPTETTVTLDDRGTLVWQHCNGKFTVQEIVNAMQKRFGSDAEPALERLIVFLRMLSDHRLVRFYKPEDAGRLGTCQ